MPFLVAAAVLLAAYGIGSVLAWPVGGTVARGLRGEATTFALGFGVFGLIVFGVGRAGALDRTVLVPLTLAAAAVGVTFAVPRVRRLPAFSSAAGRERWILAAVGVLAALDAFLASAPPTSGDAITYHLTTPKMWLQAGRITDVWWGDWVNFQPFGAEMLYAAAQALWNGSAAMVVGAGLTAFSAVCVYGLGRAIASEWVGALAALVWVAQGMFVWEATGAFVDAITGGFVALAVWHLVELRRSQRTADAAFAGLAGGLAAGVKYFGLIFVPFLAAAAVLIARNRRARVFAAFAALALVAAPWYVKNWIVAANPVYPLFAGAIGGKYWGPSGEAFLRYKEAQYGLNGIWHLPLIPLEFVTRTDRFDRGYSLSPAFFLLAPLAVLARRRWVLIFLATVLAYVVLWFEAMYQIPRYLLPVFPFAAVAAAYAGVELWRRQPWGRAWVVLVAAVSVVPFVLMTGLFAWRLAPGALRLDSTQDFVQRQTGTYDAFQWLDTNLPREGRILMGLQGLYWLDRPSAMYSAPLFGPLVPPATTAARMRSIDVRYAAFPQGELPDTLRQIRPRLRVIARLPLEYVTSRSLGRVERKTLVVYRWPR